MSEPELSLALVLGAPIVTFFPATRPPDASAEAPRIATFLRTQLEADARRADEDERLVHRDKSSPQRVLAEIDQRRRDIEGRQRIVSAYVHAVHAARATDPAGAADQRLWRQRRESLEPVVRLIAQEFAGRAGWRPEWRA